MGNTSPYLNILRPFSRHLAPFQHPGMSFSFPFPSFHSVPPGLFFHASPVQPRPQSTRNFDFLAEASPKPNYSQTSETTAQYRPIPYIGISQHSNYRAAALPTHYPSPSTCICLFIRTKDLLTLHEDTHTSIKSRSYQTCWNKENRNKLWKFFSTLGSKHWVFVH